MSKKYFLIVNKEKVDVSEEVYKEYWKITNHENYLERVDRKNHLLFFSNLNTEDTVFEEMIEDKSVDVEKIVETKMRIEDLYTALSKLNEEERKIIDSIYFEEKSIREIAKETNTNPMKISRKHKNILDKIRNLLSIF
ncbi:sigma-70 family RNA polymerase sigma factor [Helcococcus ovis]|uniref:sigma-70 family RNA polymerase sigma factor n=1 Tax=Helcococcus ovis TaxID=72026 RepID=UPI00106F88C8|nr:sigma-70 family RNA polymerase sigma factor [Helcococcus ovis]TFF65030.1 sigma-70 family RNA polymerase sigma factor [Helcococcus ovis]